MKTAKPKCTWKQNKRTGEITVTFKMSFQEMARLAQVFGSMSHHADFIAEELNYILNDASPLGALAAASVPPRNPVAE